MQDQASPAPLDCQTIDPDSMFMIGHSCIDTEVQASRNVSEKALIKKLDMSEHAQDSRCESQAIANLFVHVEWGQK